MTLKEDWVRLVASALKDAGAVPLPGGHGVYFTRVLAMCSSRAGMPGVAERCYIALAALGDAEERGKWNRKEWLPHVGAWFDVHCKSVGLRIDAADSGYRWQYLLAGMLLVVKESGKSAFGHTRVSESADLRSKAHERLLRLTRGKIDVGGIPLAGQGAAGTRVSPPQQVSEAWQLAMQALCDDTDRVRMLYFMYVLHSSLGMPQPELDKAYPTRKRAYGRLKAILAEGSITSCNLRAAAFKVAAALDTTPMLHDVEEVSPWTAQCSARLPSCFREAHRKSRPPVRALVAVQVEKSPAAGRVLKEAHDLAEAVADLVLDPVRAGRPGFTSFGPSHYRLFYSQVLYGGTKYARLEGCGKLPPDDEVVGQEGPTTAQPMSVSLAKCYSRENYYIAQCQLRLESVMPMPTWPQDTGVQRCMICHSQVQARS
jgi:hypothetical protein